MGAESVMLTVLLVVVAVLLVLGVVLASASVVGTPSAKDVVSLGRRIWQEDSALRYELSMGAVGQPHQRAGQLGLHRVHSSRRLLDGGAAIGGGAVPEVGPEEGEPNPVGAGGSERGLLPGPTGDALIDRRRPRPGNDACRLRGRPDD